MDYKHEATHSTFYARLKIKIFIPPMNKSTKNVWQYSFCSEFHNNVAKKKDNRGKNVNRIS